MNKSYETCRKRIFQIIEVGSGFDWQSRSYDFLNAAAILLNLAASILFTFESVRGQYESLLLITERLTVAFFCIDYLLRIWTAKYLHRNLSPTKSLRKYVFSFTGLVDLFSFLPYFLPFFFPAGTIAFRLLRLARIFRLFRINAYYDSLNVITEVIVSKKQQLLSSVFIILILMVSSSLCMYSLEHEVQPDVFSNAFSGIWWAASTLLTVGYGDIYPITTLGKLFGICTAFLGVGMVAIPTGIISAGFVDQYSRIKRMTEYGMEKDINFIRMVLQEDDPWVEKSIQQLQLPSQVIVALIQRNGKPLVPRAETVLQTRDTIVLGARSLQRQSPIRLKEILLKKNNPWVGEKIRDLDISRKSIVALVKRQNTLLIPHNDLVLKEFDTIVLYTQSRLDNPDEISEIEL